MPSKNTNLRKAARIKNDEYYTYLADIERELKWYNPQFKGKVVVMPCDDPELIPELKGQKHAEKRASQFWVHFHMSFKHLGLKKIIATHYAPGKQAYKIEYTGGDDTNINAFTKTTLKGDGDFRSDEVKAIIDTADIVVTNPPFSLFMEFVDQIVVEQKKQILTIGNKNAYCSKNIFRLIKENKLWTGYSHPRDFLIVNDKGEVKASKKLGGLTRWFTNLEVQKRYENIELWREYSPEKYPKYDHLDAINVDAVRHIPCDYNGIMGVPLTFIDKYNPDQFEIIDGISRYFFIKPITANIRGKFLSQINGKTKYARILIRRVR